MNAATASALRGEVAPAGVRIRPATTADAAALLAIYRPFVEATAVSFETAVPTVGEFAARVDKALARWHWLVAEADDGVLGYAYGSSHRERAAYRWSVEVSAYVAARGRRRGVGRALYLQLFDALAQQGYCNAYAGVALPNPREHRAAPKRGVPTDRHVRSGGAQVRALARRRVVPAAAP